MLSMQLGSYKNMLDKQKMLLKMSPKVSKNDTSEAIMAILDAIQTHLADKPEQAG